MKIMIVLSLTLFSGIASAVSAMSWNCSGFDLIEEGSKDGAEALTFNLVLSEHDGNDFQWKAMENITYANGIIGEDIELMENTVVCGKDDDGNDRIGSQVWSLDINTGKFLLVSGCENEKMIIEATCK